MVMKWINLHIFIQWKIKYKLQHMIMYKIWNECKKKKKKMHMTTEFGTLIYLVANVDKRTSK